MNQKNGIKKAFSAISAEPDDIDSTWLYEIFPSHNASCVPENRSPAGFERFGKA